MNITGKIKGIKYKINLTETLISVDYAKFNINTAPTSCLVNSSNGTFALSKWVSPKRTRSYPYERVYNTLNISKKITVIPIVKDEGINGDRDYIQWDTVALMSLLDVFVILAYYNKAEVSSKNSNKITNQQFDNRFIKKKIKEIQSYHSSALHWNLNELNDGFKPVMKKVVSSYKKIEIETGIQLHSLSGLENFQNKISEDISHFMEFSRNKAEKAQQREFVTMQPKESLSTLTKAKITINNYLGGQYFFTVDEIEIEEGFLKLIESKHSKNSLLPSFGDIKDGLIKMILFTNLVETKVDNLPINTLPVLSLTSSKLIDSIDSNSSAKELSHFFEINQFNRTQSILVNKLFSEANVNKFVVKIGYSK